MKGKYSFKNSRYNTTLQRNNGQACLNPINSVGMYPKHTNQFLQLGQIVSIVLTFCLFSRLDTLMGGDFQQYRANVYCKRPECPHASTFGNYHIRTYMTWLFDLGSPLISISFLSWFNHYSLWQANSIITRVSFILNLLLKTSFADQDILVNNLVINSQDIKLVGLFNISLILHFKSTHDTSNHYIILVQGPGPSNKLLICTFLYHKVQARTRLLTSTAWSATLSAPTPTRWSRIVVSTRSSTLSRLPALRSSRLAKVKTVSSTFTALSYSS